MTDVSRAVCRSLASYLDANTSGFSEIYPEWPGANEDISLPALSITCSNPTFTKCPPYLLSSGSVTEHAAVNKYVVGQYDFIVQLDLWAKYKVQRSTLYQEVFEALHSSLDGGSIITLTDYYSQLCGLTEISHRLPDDAETSSRQEWRAIIELEGTCSAIIERNDYMVTQEPDLTFTTLNLITEE